MPGGLSQVPKAQGVLLKLLILSDKMTWWSFLVDLSNHQIDFYCYHLYDYNHILFPFPPVFWKIKQDSQ